ncbi:MAG: MmgE/PrpD family protein [Hoeflea sp.]|uniref:MmgE/PrpD family protein n=1 Tax=Hoeflea sp. TaxID=1940281 RepID=UPI001D9ABDB0|nr:MmgE/PrpD family protein [Hoeflea sp.]MBU4530343.1 MmgE/PrpD family protein [Alphaproteobacteria bacterium]MBU4545130.1 MmgE/PrpD family protein [Alphaproteobacteria bacterium]MBU4549670.1 MmgE/PrpD family protein [Alphaproteobacteria bacterium]MBV1721933.1 MmgE/PrpD family protein [Hoeflea sp.]MBV1761283.1 MmgE/PrpD family protein [Hoeflea sp.]
MSSHTHIATNAEVPAVTRQLVDWIVDIKGSDIPADVRREGLRTFVNWVGCAVGGARHETIDRALAAVTPFSGKATSTVLGRPERLDALHAALLNGITSHVLDYDDTHLKTIIHPAGPVASALLSLAELRPMSGEDFLTALIVGIEVECRIGNAVYPNHYDRGWHITGTAGVFGAAAATGKAIGLSRQQMRWAFGIAATQSSGLREMFGTMTKSFHPGRAAQNGLFSALLAEANFDSSERAIEAPRGFANVTSTKQDYSEILDDLGTRWESALNSYKPFACGIVIHPTIDGCQQIRSEIGDRVNAIKSVHLTTHPLVLELTGKKTPRTGLEGKFSVFHSAAAALLKGDGAPTAFTDELVNLPEIISLRDRISATSDPDCHEASVTIDVTFEDGSTLTKHIERALGSKDVPLTDEQIDTKFITQSSLVIGEQATRALLAISWDLESLSSVAEVARISVGGSKANAKAV